MSLRPPPSPILLRFLRSCLSDRPSHCQRRFLSAKATNLYPKSTASQPEQPTTLSSSSSTSSTSSSSSSRPRDRDRGPASTEDTQTDFATLDILSRTPRPAASVDACLANGFHLSNGMRVRDAGVLILGGEAFTWRPWLLSNASTPGKSDGNSNRLLNARGQWHPHGTPVADSGRSGAGSQEGTAVDPWALLRLLYPRPDLLILGTGSSVVPLSPDMRALLADLGVRVEVQDTRNAAAQFNLLATERGVDTVGAGLVPIGWRESRGLVGRA